MSYIKYTCQGCDKQILPECHIQFCDNIEIVTWYYCLECIKKFRNLIIEKSHPSNRVFMCSHPEWKKN